MEEKNSVRIQRWQQNLAHSAHGLTTYQAADIIRTTTQATLKQSGRSEQHQVKVRRRPNGKFDVLVFDQKPQKAVTPVTPKAVTP